MLDGIVIRIFLPFHVDIDIAGLLCEGIRRIREGETEGQEGVLAAFLKDFGGGQFVEEHRFEVFARAKADKNRLRPSMFWFWKTSFPLKIASFDWDSNYNFTLGIFFFFFNFLKITSFSKVKEDHSTHIYIYFFQEFHFFRFET